MIRSRTLGLAFTLIFSACDYSCTSAPKTKGALPAFDQERAYQDILSYEKLGFKIPGTDSHVKTGDWIVSELKGLGLTVHEQKTTAETFDHKTIPVRNIVGQVNPSAKTRYLMSAHWDTRPFADEDPEFTNRKKPVPGVNDGGSGVVVLLGLARALKGQEAFGVDFVFLDAEDWGHPSTENSYCLGTQYFAKHPIPEGVKHKFGINFDMVGRMGASFPMEGYSFHRAPGVLQKIQMAAKSLGYQDYFPLTRAGSIIDDHVYLMQGLGIPVVDLIHLTPEGRFPPEWHTVRDTSEAISRETLKVVGQTVLQVLWNEN